MNVDLVLFRAVNGLAGRSAVLDALGIVAADWFVYMMVFGLFALWFRRVAPADRFRDRLAIINAIWVGLLAEILKWFITIGYVRSRPFVAESVTKLIAMSAESASFPSGHATFAFGIATSVFLYDRRFGAPFLIVAALVAVGRVFVGVHYPSDVFVGSVFGVLLAFLVKFGWFRIDRQLVAILSRFTGPRPDAR